MKRKVVGEEREVPECPCLSCGRVLDRVSSVGETEKVRPASGDVTVCLGCGHVMALNEDLRLRELTPAEMVMIAGDPRILLIQAARAMAAKEKKNADPS